MCFFMKKSITTLSLLLSLNLFSNGGVCFESIDCQDFQSIQSLGLFSSVIKNNITTLEKLVTQELLEPKSVIQPKTSYTNTIKLVNLSVGLRSMVAINLKNETINSILKKVLPNWQIDIDDDLQDIRLDIVIQTTRKQAILDIARSLSAKARFYKYTKPKPTLTLLKI